MKKFLKISLLILLIIVLLFILNKYLMNNLYEKFDNANDKWIILLTTAVNNDDERKNIYIESITKWLNNTPFNIFVVESSNYPFNEFKDNERFYCHTFSFNEKFPSSSQSEANSILNILDNIKDNEKYKKCKYILKVTGRYYLDGIENVLNNLEDNKDLYLQIHRKNNWQNSEYYGIKKELLNELCLNIKEIGLFENKLFEFSNNKNWVNIGPFKNNIKRGGDGLIINEL